MKTVSHPFLYHLCKAVVKAQNNCCLTKGCESPKCQTPIELHPNTWKNLKISLNK